jgi:hypothetical protein
MIQAAEMLLQEIPMKKAVLKSRLRDLAPIESSAKGD